MQDYPLLHHYTRCGGLQLTTLETVVDAVHNRLRSNVREVRLARSLAPQVSELAEELRLALSMLVPSSE